MERKSVLSLFASVLVIFAITLLPTQTFGALLSDTEQAWFDENKSNLYFATTKDYPPFIWSQYDTLFGISSDYLNYIQEKLVIDFPEKEPRSRTDILKAIKEGELSFVSSITETPERADFLLFTRPYLTLPTIFVGKSGTKAKTGSEIVQRKLKVSVGNDYGVHEYLRNRYPEMILIPVDNNYLVLQNILTGVSEIGAINVASLAYLVREHEMENLRKLSDTGFDVRLAFAVPKEMPEFRNILDNIIESMPENMRNAIITRWITDPATIENLSGNVLGFSDTRSDRTTLYLIAMGALLLFSLGFIGHYIFVRSTPKKDESGHIDYVP